MKDKYEDYPVQEVLMGDKAGLSPQGNHACLNTNRLALRSVEVVRAPDLDWQVTTVLSISREKSQYLASSS